LGGAAGIGWAGVSQVAEADPAAARRSADRDEAWHRQAAEVLAEGARLVDTAKLRFAPLFPLLGTESRSSMSSSTATALSQIVAVEYCRADDDTSTSKWAWNYPIGDVDDPLCETGPTIVKISAGRGDLAGLASTMGQSCESEHDRRVAAFRPDHQQKIETLACGSCQNPFGSTGRFVREIKPLVHGGRCRGRWAEHTEVKGAYGDLLAKHFGECPRHPIRKKVATSSSGGEECLMCGVVGTKSDCTYTARFNCRCVSGL
jgi:hypothetical protein